jgi:hypothetical protein
VAPPEKCQLCMLKVDVGLTTNPLQELKRPINSFCHPTPFQRSADPVFGITLQFPLDEPYRHLPATLLVPVEFEERVGDHIPIPVLRLCRVVAG